MRRWRLLLLLMAGIGLAYFAVERGQLTSRAPGASKEAAPPIPVLAATVKRDDVPVFLTGFGTVQPFNSVLVKSRVDGQIVKINFSEGKDIKSGEVLVEIDPAPFEAALAQARANKLKDEAQLKNRLHDHFDDVIVDRCLHSIAAHGRSDWTVIPRIFGHRQRRNSNVRRYCADTDANDVWVASQASKGGRRGRADGA